MVWFHSHYIDVHRSETKKKLMFNKYCKMKSVINIIACVFVVFITSSADCAKILCIFPYPSHSHHVVYRTITKELSKRGHELTIFTTDPLNDRNLLNYTEIDMHNMYEEINKRFNFVEASEIGIWKIFEKYYDFFAVLSDQVMSNPVTIQLLANKTKFDVIIAHCAGLDAVSVLSYKFDAPMIGITTMPLVATTGYVFAGNPLQSSYSPNTFLPFSDNMNFWQRMINLYVNLRQLYEYSYIHLPKQEAILRKHFSEEKFDITKFRERIQLLLVNSHPYLNYPSALVPNIIQIGGLRHSRLNKTLPQDLKKILDDSKSGFIYFSLGTNLKSNRLPSETVNILLAAFSELPYQIIWKFESDALSGKPDNVYIAKWLPQHGILSHPNIKLFMYQGGSQSTEEAIECTVPVLGFPLYSDQMFNVKALVKLGVAKSVDIYNIDKDMIKDTIVEMASNTSYKKSMETLHKLYQDRPMHPLDQTIWWIEHVIRNKGAHHLQTHARQMSWLTLNNIDIFAFLAVTFIAIFCISAIILYYIFRRINLISIKYFSMKINTSKKSKTS